ncbi:hypothetical protein SEA_WEASELS2_235 [Rhodococcus phage Weasels2]|uniref:Uncharacterized protein n=1 Tax=Rhodococcus phage Weasels2 TaxID=1897437 RepID=A0A1I9SAK7_9CAUD|nr:hypothetical protein FDH04_gp181 [Rhodococcus phage Weasels2]AOZ63813.1 hypothetical protein SEA_WEASELS2_235 [Rhodococcus phage Weasels2]
MFGKPKETLRIIKDTSYEEEPAKVIEHKRKGPAILPDSHLEDHEDCIENLPVGRTAYTVPWAMWVNSKGECFLHPQYTWDRKPGGTVDMLIRRERDGFYVKIPPDEKYERRNSPGYNSSADTKYIPVQGWI